MKQSIDWFVFIASGQPKHVSVTRISPALCAAIGCSSNLVRIDHRYALKSTHKHRLKPNHFLILEPTIRFGRVVIDKAKHLTFFHLDYIHGQWFQASIKRNEAEDELWVVTFHPASDNEVRRMIKKYGELT